MLATFEEVCDAAVACDKSATLQFGTQARTNNCLTEEIKDEVLVEECQCCMLAVVYLRSPVTAEEVACGGYIPSESRLHYILSSVADVYMTATA